MLEEEKQKVYKVLLDQLKPAIRYYLSFKALAEATGLSIVTLDMTLNQLERERVINQYVFLAQSGIGSEDIFHIELV